MTVPIGAKGPRLIRLVRHGRAAAGWDTDPDPGLDEIGLTQAAGVARTLAPVGLSRIVTSPLRRCRATAQELADLCGAAVTVEPAVAEIPTPDGVAMVDRVVWLRDAMQGTWSALGPRYSAYRDAVVDFVRGCDDATVIFSHFVAINCVIGACLGDDRLVIRSLDNCSITTIGVESKRLTLVEGGREADTLIR